MSFVAGGLELIFHGTQTSLHGTTRHHQRYTHLDVLFGVFQILKQGVFTPHDPALLVGRRVRVTVGLTGLTTKEAVQIRSLLVRTTLLDRVALRALGLEDLGSLLFAHIVSFLGLQRGGWIGRDSLCYFGGSLSMRQHAKRLVEKKCRCEDCGDCVITLSGERRRERKAKEFASFRRGVLSSFGFL